MISKRSDLVLDNFIIVDSQLSFVILNEQTDIQPAERLNSYPVDIDFSLEQDNHEEFYRIVVAVKINFCDNKDPGYSIFVTGMGFFKFAQNTKLNEEQKIQMLQTSGLSICITNVRSYIANQTSYFPWGSYSFHAVDIQHLLEEKQKTSENNSN
jgi:preprotein translocase subunit SecB